MQHHLIQVRRWLVERVPVVGSIVGNNPEQSTVELAEQFVSVIYQRSANSRSISTADDLL